ncbi:MAG: division/cell wall cluster transcriptional repressor MraZ [Clostridia bacterium]|nr:division/cell wall cluster transcriptional repressor MraZ [Clostridia bacterium]
MLIGTYQHNIDPKGRVIIPAKFREELGDVFYATRGDDFTIAILSKKAWDELGEKIAQLPSSKTVKLRRFLFSNAAELVPDKQGRVLLPQKLREYAGIEKDVVINGAGSRVEIWDSAAWDKYDSDQSEEDVFGLMEELEI